MDDQVRALAAAQGGLLTRAQLAAHGVAASRLAPSAGELVRVRQGVYADAVVWAVADERARLALQVAAERLRTGVDLVAAGRTAAVLHGLPLLGAAHVLTLAERKPERPQHHGASRTVHPDDVCELAGVPVTTMARTAVDVARRGFAGGVVTVDAALRAGVARAELEAVLARSRRWPGRLTAVDVVAFADGLSESPLESLGRARFHEAGLPPPALQVWISDHRGAFARVDQCWRDRWTIAEADGAVKYEDRRTLFEEKQREDRLREAGFEVVRYTWDEALRSPELVAARVTRAFTRADRRRAA